MKTISAKELADSLDPQPSCIGQVLVMRPQATSVCGLKRLGSSRLARPAALLHWPGAPTTRCVLVLLYVSSYNYICTLVVNLYICRRTVCVLVVLDACPHTAVCLSGGEEREWLLAALLADLLTVFGFTCCFTCFCQVEKLGGAQRHPPTSV
jgi:hypothetical protein